MRDRTCYVISQLLPWWCVVKQKKCQTLTHYTVTATYIIYTSEENEVPVYSVYSLKCNMTLRYMTFKIKQTYDRTKGYRTFRTDTRQIQGSSTPVVGLALILHTKENFFRQQTQFSCTSCLWMDTAWQRKRKKERGWIRIITIFTKRLKTSTLYTFSTQKRATCILLTKCYIQFNLFISSDWSEGVDFPQQHGFVFYLATGQSCSFPFTFPKRERRDRLMKVISPSRISQNPRNEHKIKQAPKYPEELVIFLNYPRFSQYSTHRNPTVSWPTL